MASLNFTESRIRELPFRSGIWRDEQVKGLLVICHAATKTYAVQGDVRHIRTVRMKIDRVDRIGLREARNRAKAIMSQIQSGVDPTARPKETGITLLQALDEHLQEKPLRDATIESYRYNIEHYLSRYKNRAVADLSHSEVREIYHHLRDAKGQPTATGAMRTLRAVINTAMRIDETLTTNPVAFIRLPVGRSRQVDEIDLADWWEKTEALSPIRRDLHRAMLLTGARRASILNVKRKDMDLDRGVLIFNHMKTGGRMLFPMGSFLRAMVRERLEDDLPLDNPWLWPSPLSGKGCTSEPKERKRGLPSPHEYRHHARTMYIAAGVPYAESALLLGQRLPGASGGYVHAEHLVEHLRPHAQALENRIVAARASLPRLRPRRIAMPRDGKGPRPRPNAPLPVQRQRPAKKQGRVTIEDVEAVVRWYLDTHWFTPWFDTEVAAAYLRRESGTLKGWRSKGDGPRFYTVNGQFVRYHIDDLDAFVRGGKVRKRIPEWLMDKVAERAAERLLPAVKPPREGDDK